MVLAAVRPSVVKWHGANLVDLPKLGRSPRRKQISSRCESGLFLWDVEMSSLISIAWQFPLTDPIERLRHVRGLEFCCHRGSEHENVPTLHCPPSRWKWAPDSPRRAEQPTLLSWSVESTSPFLSPGSKNGEGLNVWKSNSWYYCPSKKFIVARGIVWNGHQQLYQ